jgi:hypothetical protein
VDETRLNRAFRRFDALKARHPSHTRAIPSPEDARLTFAPPLLGGNLLLTLHPNWSSAFQLGATMALASVLAACVTVTQAPDPSKTAPTPNRESPSSR